VIIKFRCLNIMIPRKSSIIWDITPCSLLKVNRSFGRTCRLHLQGRRICQTRKQRESRWQVEQTCSSETSVDFQRTTRRYIPEDRTLRNHRCENLISYIIIPRLEKPETYSLFTVDYGLYPLYLPTTATDVVIQFYIASKIFCKHFYYIKHMQSFWGT
jgi:hypothetical protein